jgi:hypothetical protein
MNYALDKRMNMCYPRHMTGLFLLTVYIKIHFAPHREHKPCLLERKA